MSSLPLFRDRAEAGEQLAQVILSEITQLKLTTGTATNEHPMIIYGLPRGGLPVAAPIARLLGCPLNVIVAKKISFPENPELAIGAATADGHVLWASKRLRYSRRREVALEQAQLKAMDQMQKLAPFCPKVNLQGAIALVVDDGIATGMTMAVAAQALRAGTQAANGEQQKPAAVWICAPVAPPDLIPVLQEWSDRTIILATPQPFLSVSRFYAQFPQVEMEEALYYLREVNKT